MNIESIDMNSNKKIYLYDSDCIKMNIPNVSHRPLFNSNISPLSISFANRMLKYKTNHDLSHISINSDDNIGWEIPAFVIIGDDSILGHKRVHSSIEKKLKMDVQYNTNEFVSQSQRQTPLHMKRCFSIIYEQCSIIKDSNLLTFNRLSYAKISDHCSLNYPKSVRNAYKQLFILWLKHIEEYPEYWEGFDVKQMKKIYKNELYNMGTGPDDLYNPYNTCNDPYEDPYDDSHGEYKYHNSLDRL
jgi:hypothetical protein